MGFSIVLLHKITQETFQLTPFYMEFEGVKIQFEQPE